MADCVKVQGMSAGMSKIRETLLTKRQRLLLGLPKITFKAASPVKKEPTILLEKLNSISTAAEEEQSPPTISQNLPSPEQVAPDAVPLETET